MDVRPPHIPACRRVDGERITEMIPAREWLSRKDKNPLKIHPRAIYPPSLPRYASRDHLHDRNRELCVFDPANPGLEAYVHVTRRRQHNHLFLSFISHLGIRGWAFEAGHSRLRTRARSTRTVCTV